MKGGEFLDVPSVWDGRVCCRIVAPTAALDDIDDVCQGIFARDELDDDRPGRAIVLAVELVADSSALLSTARQGRRPGSRARGGRGRPRYGLLVVVCHYPCSGAGSSHR